MLKEKFLVIVHLYYTEMWKNIKACLENLDDFDFDLIVTTNKTNEALNNEIYSFKSNTSILQVENVGYDIWPFVFSLNKVDLSKYDYLIKLHSKRDMGNIVFINDDNLYFQGKDWRNFLLSFIRTKRHIYKCVNSFKKQHKLGMINNWTLFVNNNGALQNKHQEFCRVKAIDLLKKMGIYKNNCEDLKFIAGTMFICKPFLLQPLKNLGLNSSDFSSVNRSKEDDLAHIVERVLGYLVISQGYKIEDTFTSIYEKKLILSKNLLKKFYFKQKLYRLKHRYLNKFLRFIFRIDINNDYFVFKVFKLKIGTLKKNN